MEYRVVPLKNYPDTGHHLECITELPFKITKGEDPFSWVDERGVRREYNGSLKKIDDRWIVYIKKKVNESLSKIFHIKVNKDLDVILKYCVDVYGKSLHMELEKFNETIDNGIREQVEEGIDRDTEGSHRKHQSSREITDE